MKRIRETGGEGAVLSKNMRNECSKRQYASYADGFMPWVAVSSVLHADARTASAFLFAARIIRGIRPAGVLKPPAPGGVRP